ncbi:MAG TPA: hypothetical protein VH479_03335 [Acidimicrobiales bacterium]
MLEIINNFIQSFQVLVAAGILLLAIVFVGMTWIRTRSVAPTLGAVLLGAVVVWGVNNIDVLENKVNEDVNQGGTLTP